MHRPFFSRVSLVLVTSAPVSSRIANWRPASPAIHQILMVAAAEVVNLTAGRMVPFSSALVFCWKFRRLVPTYSSAKVLVLSSTRVFSPRITEKYSLITISLPLLSALAAITSISAPMSRTCTLDSSAKAAGSISSTMTSASRDARILRVIFILFPPKIFCSGMGIPPILPLSSLYPKERHLSITVLVNLSNNANEARAEDRHGPQTGRIRTFSFCASAPPVQMQTGTWLQSPGR